MKIFFSYCHKDSSLRDELEVHLSPLKREGYISTWHDRNISAGSNFAGEIDSNLESSSVILLLVSPYFLASDYCYDIEMKRALELDASGAAKVLPIILEPCDWQSSPFGHLLALPRDGKPITKYSNYHDALLQVATAIRKIVTDSNKKSTSQTIDIKNKIQSTLEPRSSNLRVAKTFSDSERDIFRYKAFEYIAKYFENSLSELEARNPEIETLFRRVDANYFTSAIYSNGNKVSSCSIEMGGMLGDITYSVGDQSSRNSCNEWLSIEHDGYVPTLKPGGMSFHRSSDIPLTMEGASEFFWEMLMAPLQGFH